MNEKMINALIKRLEDLKLGKYGNLEELTYSQILYHLADITKRYALEGSELLELARNFRGLTMDEFKTMSDTDKDAK